MSGNARKAQDHQVELLDDEFGATAVEYGLLLALIAAVIIAVVTTLGGQIAALFTTLVGAF